MFIFFDEITLNGAELRGKDLLMKRYGSASLLTYGSEQWALTSRRMFRDER